MTERLVITPSALALIGVGTAARVTFSASLARATFYVSRVRDGWVVWHQVH